jgi:tRNA threonylcarbamoyladenosine biosynthesis protein TsaE
MNSELTYKTVSTSPDASLQLGAQIGRALKGGEVIELASDLGGGKTVITKGIAAGLGYKGEVASPTFTISRVYNVRDDLELHHFDFYRIGSSDIVADELREVVGDPQVVVAVEWAGNAGDALPQERIRIDIKAIGETEREITVTALDAKFNYVVEALK